MARPDENDDQEQGGCTPEWWTFAGAKANACLAATLRHDGIEVRRFDNFSVTFGGESSTAVSNGIGRVRSGESPAQPPTVTDEALEGLKFSACLPEPLARSVLQQRTKDQAAFDWVLRTQHAVVSIQPNEGSN